MHWGNWHISFVHPAYLIVAAVLIPVIWLVSFRSLAGLGPVRRVLALTLRSLLVLLFAVALAEIQWVEKSDRVTVIYVLDQSESIPPAKRRLMLEYVVRQVRRHRNARQRDRAGVVVFGRQAVVEVPPFDDDLPPTTQVESTLGETDATNLAAALKLASALFPEDTARRIVLVTDGNENLGQVREIAPSLARNGIGIDVVPVKLTTRAEVAVENVILPSRMRRQQKFRGRIVLSNYTDDDKAEPVRGVVRVTRSSGGREEPVGEDVPVELKPGKTVLTFEHEIDSPGIYTYKATFVPENAEDDLMPQNNVATAFTHVQGKGRVLLIEDHMHPGEFDFLVDRLRAMNLEVDTMSTSTLFASLAELQAYDVVILANVPRSSGDDETSVAAFSDAQIQMLANNTAQLGAGLIMLGGDRSFGAGGWANTELEKVMPVDFQIKNAKIKAVGALVMVMHASEMAQGNFWQKVVAREALKTLGPLDYCGILHWSDFGRDSWLWRPGLARVGTRRKTMIRALARMTPGDMPAFEPSMRMALAEFRKNKASIKHMIIISDGDPSAPPRALVQRFAQDGIKITTVAIGAHGVTGTKTLQDIAQITGGNYYRVRNAKALPRIYQREARRVTRPVVKDLANIPPRLVLSHPIVSGIRDDFPPLQGMVLTTVKENPLVEVILRSPDPSDNRNNAILAAWTYNNGRAVAFTTDAGYRWANAWTSWPHYDQLFSQMVRWAMRPAEDDEAFDVATTVRDGKVRVTITALDTENQYTNFLGLTGAAIGPNQEPFSFPIRQVAPGRYEGEFTAREAGSYHITIGGRGPGKPPLIVGANVPYSSEYKDRTSNVELLKELAALRPQGGQAGKVIGDDLTPAKLESLVKANPFRRDLPRAVTMHEAWPWFLFVAGLLFFADVAVRRIAIRRETWQRWIEPIRKRLRRRTEAVEVEAKLQRLQKRKEQLADDLSRKKAATRFEPDTIPTEELDEVAPPVAAAASKQKPDSGATFDEPEESYTDRLRRAKEQARRKLKRNDAEEDAE